MPNETVQTPQVPSGNVAAAQATLSVPAATAQVSSAAPAAEQETYLYFMPSCSFRLACSFRLLVFVLRVFCFIDSPVFSPFYASFTFAYFMLRVCLHMAVSVRDMFEFICMLLWPLGLWRFFVTIFYLACCSCHRGFTGACLSDVWVCLHAALAIGALQMLLAKCLSFCFARFSCHRGFAGACLSDVWVCLHAALAIGALQMLLAACLSFVLHAALAIGASQVFVCVMFEFILHAALAIGVLQMLCPMFEFCSARCCLPSGLCMCLVVTCFSLFCTLLLPSGLCGCLFCHIIEFILHAALAVGASRVLVCQLLYLSFVLCAALTIRVLQICAWISFVWRFI